MTTPITTPVLLNEALAVLKSRLLPNASADTKYEVLMCMNAISIALRQHEAGTDQSQDLQHYSDETIKEIREGKYDDLSSQATVALLNALTCSNNADINISNPKAIANNLK